MNLQEYCFMQLMGYLALTVLTTNMALAGDIFILLFILTYGSSVSQVYRKDIHDADDGADAAAMFQCYKLTCLWWGNTLHCYFRKYWHYLWLIYLHKSVAVMSSMSWGWCGVVLAWHPILLTDTSILIRTGFSSSGQRTGALKPRGSVRRPTSSYVICRRLRLPVHNWQVQNDHVWVVLGFSDF